MSFISLYTIIKKETMVADFPPMPQPIVGDPTIHKLFRIYRYLRSCTQS